MQGLVIKMFVSRQKKDFSEYMRFETISKNYKIDNFHIHFNKEYIFFQERENVKRNRMFFILYQSEQPKKKGTD